MNHLYQNCISVFCLGEEKSDRILGTKKILYSRKIFQSRVKAIKTVTRIWSNLMLPLLNTGFLTFCGQTDTKVNLGQNYG